MQNKIHNRPGRAFNPWYMCLVIATVYVLLPYAHAAAAVAGFSAAAAGGTV